MTVLAVLGLVLVCRRPITSFCKDTSHAVSGDECRHRCLISTRFRGCSGWGSSSVWMDRSRNSRWATQQRRDSHLCLCCSSLVHDSSESGCIFFIGVRWWCADNCRLRSHRPPPFDCDSQQISIVTFPTGSSREAVSRRGRNFQRHCVFCNSVATLHLCRILTFGEGHDFTLLFPRGCDDF